MKKIIKIFILYHVTNIDKCTLVNYKCQMNLNLLISFLAE